MLQFKVGVKFVLDGVPVQPQIISALAEINEIYKKYKTVCVVTSLLDGVHSLRSLHYQGKAADLRTRTLKPGDVTNVANDIKAVLGKDYDVIIEVDHIHVEFDPR